MVRESWVLHPGGLPMFVHPVFKRDIREIAGCASALYLYASEHEIHRYGDSYIFKDAIKVIHDHGLRAIVSVGTGGRFSAMNPSTWHLSHPETWVQPPALPEGSQLRLLPKEYCCVNNPAFIEYTRDYYRRLFDENKVDGIGFDEPREFPCLCTHCRDKYRREKGSDMSGLCDRAQLEFQAESLAEYIKIIADIAKERGAVTASVVYLQPSEEYFHRMLIRIPTLDYFGIDPYWFEKPVEYVGEHTREARTFCKGTNKLLWVVIQGFHMPAGTEHQIYDAGKIAADNGADVLCGFSHWRGTENPEAAWDTTHRMLKDFGPKRNA